MLEALHEKTAKLPEVELAMPGARWEEYARGDFAGGVSWDSGDGQGAGGELCDGVGFWLDIIATGGDAAKLFEGWELVHAIAPDLTPVWDCTGVRGDYIKHGT